MDFDICQLCPRYLTELVCDVCHLRVCFDCNIEKVLMETCDSCFLTMCSEAHGMKEYKEKGKKNGALVYYCKKCAKDYAVS